jgi:CheY-like chemotaxis protein
MKTRFRSGARILLVDDNPHGLTARKMILEEHGYSVKTAVSGEQAWQLVQESAFDVVVTDFRMGEMNGGELIRLIRASDSTARIILLSGFVACLGLSEENTAADEVICKSDKEIPELLRALKKLARRPIRRPAASVKGNAGPLPRPL